MLSSDTVQRFVNCLIDCRRLCILKGVFPREPRNRKRAQKGNESKVQTLYYEKVGTGVKDWAGDEDEDDNDLDYVYIGYPVPAA